MKFLVLPGDGIGPEITRATVAVLDAASRRFGLGLEYEYADIGFAALEKTGTTLPDGVLDRGARGRRRPPRPDLASRLPAARPGRRERLRGVPREARPLRQRAAGAQPPRDRAHARAHGPRDHARGHRGLLPRPQHVPRQRASSCRRRTSRSRCARSPAHACERIARRAFELARRRRKLVTAVHKANVFHVTDGLFLAQTRKVAAEFPDVKLEEMIVDAMAAHLVRDPARFDVVLATNFYADILSDLASELSGSLGLAGSVNAGDAQCAAQAQHGSAPDIAGPGPREPDLAHPVGGDAARVARRAARDRGVRTCGPGDLGRGRRRARRSGDAHARPRRQARHAGIRRDGRAGGCRRLTQCEARSSRSWRVAPSRPR